MAQLDEISTPDLPYPYEMVFRMNSNRVNNYTYDHFVKSISSWEWGTVFCFLLFFMGAIRKKMSLKFREIKIISCFFQRFSFNLQSCLFIRVPELIFLLSAFLDAVFPLLSLFLFLFLVKFFCILYFHLFFFLQLFFLCLSLCISCSVSL